MTAARARLLRPPIARQGSAVAAAAQGGVRRRGVVWTSCEPAVSILESVHIGGDLPMSRLFLSRNIEDGNGRAGCCRSRTAAQR
jgi:hypothetical protein